MADLKAHEVSQQCREMGEEKVRRTDAQGGGTPEWIAFEKEWLSQFDHEHKLSSQAESLKIAMSAKDAAWEAARASQNANTIATLALVAAVIAIAVSIVSAFLR